MPVITEMEIQQEHGTPMIISENIEKRIHSEPHVGIHTTLGDTECQQNLDDFKHYYSVKSEDATTGRVTSQKDNTEQDQYDSLDNSDSSLSSETSESDSETCYAEPNHLTEQTVSYMPRTSPKVHPDFEQPSTSYSKTPNKNARFGCMKSNTEQKIRHPEDSTNSSCIKKKRGIHFDTVTVYYFPRKQGFTAVPTRGGSTLGMEYRHSHVRSFTLDEYAANQSRLHSQTLQQLRSERRMNRTDVSSSDSSDSEEKLNNASVLELDPDNNSYQLQPIPIRKRRALLRAAGIYDIDASEKNECRDIRTSRVFCGCDCEDFCDPDTCPCSQAGIKCQGINFPCVCTLDTCANSSGRIEYNLDQVQTHFTQTLRRLELEKRTELDETHDSTNTDTEGRINENLDSPETGCLADGSNLSQQTEMVQIDSSGETYKGTLLRDVNLNSQMDVEPYVHAWSIKNLKYRAPDESPEHHPPSSFTFREDCYPEEPSSEVANVQDQAVVDMAPHQPFPQPSFRFSDPMFPSDVANVELHQSFPQPSYHFSDPMFPSNIADMETARPYPQPSFRFSDPIFPSGIANMALRQPCRQPTFHFSNPIFPSNIAGMATPRTFPRPSFHFSDPMFPSDMANMALHQPRPQPSFNFSDPIFPFDRAGMALHQSFPQPSLHFPDPIVPCDIAGMARHQPFLQPSFHFSNPMFPSNRAGMAPPRQFPQPSFHSSGPIFLSNRVGMAPPRQFPPPTFHFSGPMFPFNRAGMDPPRPFPPPSVHFFNPGFQTGIPTIQNENPPSHNISSGFEELAQHQQGMFGTNMHENIELNMNRTETKPLEREVQPNNNNTFTSANDQVADEKDGEQPSSDSVNRIVRELEYFLGLGLEDRSDCPTSNDSSGSYEVPLTHEDVAPTNRQDINCEVSDEDDSHILQSSNDADNDLE